MNRSDVLDRATRALASRRGGADDRRSAFVEGVLLGALVGAAIAGSTLWNRMRSRQRASVEPEGIDADPKTSTS